jgi:hypothetical protein
MTSNLQSRFRVVFPTHHSSLSTRHCPGDPLAGDILNPQSLNRYAYALNNPTTLTDPLGLDSCPGFNVNNLSWEGDATPLPCGLENNPSGPPPVTITNGSDLSCNLATAEGNWNQTMAQQFLTLCASTGNCQGGGPGALTINGTGFQWVPASSSSSNGGFTISVQTGYWQVMNAPGITLGPSGNFVTGSPFSTPGGSDSPWVLAWIPGLAPGANGWLQALAQRAKGWPKVSNPPILQPGPQAAPEIRLEDSFVKNIFDLMSKWLRGGGLGPLPPSTVMVPIVSPCAFPSFQHTPTCGGLADGEMY